MTGTIEQVAANLNQAFAADPSAIHALMCNRVPCNEALADDPTVVVEANANLGPDGTPLSISVGALGLLNSAVYTLTGKRIGIMFSDTKDEQGRSRVLGFTVWSPPETT